MRHGATEPNQRGVLVGRGVDPGLVEEGERQARALADALAGVLVTGGPTRVMSSPLRRCLETAERIAEALPDVGDVAGVVVEPRLVEIDYGEWEGLAFSEIPADAWAEWRRDPAFRPPGGESLAEVSARVADWCGEQAAGGTVVAVTHVSPVKAAVAWALDAPPTLAWRLFVGLASITTIDVRPEGPVLLSFNERAHLAALGEGAR